MWRVSRLILIPLLARPFLGQDLQVEPVFFVAQRLQHPPLSLLIGKIPAPHSGKAIFKVLVSPTGSVEHAEVLETDNEAISTEFSSQLAQTRYKPLGSVYSALSTRKEPIRRSGRLIVYFKPDGNFIVGEDAAASRLEVIRKIKKRVGH